NCYDGCGWKACQESRSYVQIRLVSGFIMFSRKTYPMKKLTVLLAALALLATTAQQASAQCYNQRQFEAEQGLRIHSELMVISLTCMKMPMGSGMYQKYQAFTSKNKKLLTGYEDDMIDYFRDTGHSAPEKQFHTLRTNLAN